MDWVGGDDVELLPGGGDEVPRVVVDDGHPGDRDDPLGQGLDDQAVLDPLVAAGLRQVGVAVGPPGAPVDADRLGEGVAGLEGQPAGGKR